MIYTIERSTLEHMQQIDIQEKNRQNSLSMYFLHIYLKTETKIVP